MTGRALELRVKALSDDLAVLLSSEPDMDLAVHSVFSRVVNLETPGGRLVTLASAGLDLMPLGLLLEGETGDLTLRTGDRVHYTDATLVLPRCMGKLLTAGAQVLPTRLLRPLCRQPGSMAALDLIRKALLGRNQEGIASLAAFLPQGGEGKGRILNPYAAYLVDDLRLLLDALSAGGLEAVARLAVRLIGFGPGLTPSFDDFLAALVLSLYYDESRDPTSWAVRSFFDRLLEGARDQTNPISRQMLAQATRGRAGLAHLAALQALVTGDLEAIRPAIRRLLAHGATSGADFLFGLYATQLCLPQRHAGSQDRLRLIARRRETLPAQKTG